MLNCCAARKLSFTETKFYFLPRIPQLSEKYAHLSSSKVFREKICVSFQFPPKVALNKLMSQ
jgi:hypothetical protein